MKKKIKKQSKSVLKVLIPDHVKKTTDNSQWCGTVNLFKKDKKKRQNSVKNWF